MSKVSFLEQELLEKQDIIDNLTKLNVALGIRIDSQMKQINYQKKQVREMKCPLFYATKCIVRPEEKRNQKEQKRKIIW